MQQRLHASARFTPMPTERSQVLLDFGTVEGTASCGRHRWRADQLGRGRAATGPVGRATLSACGWWHPDPAILETSRQPRHQPDRLVGLASSASRSVMRTSTTAISCATILLRLLKLGALITKSVRRMKIAFASSCPYQAVFAIAHHRLRCAAA